MLDKIPYEILLMVISFCDNKGRTNIRILNKFYKQLIDNVGIKYIYIKLPLRYYTYISYDLCERETLYTTTKIKKYITCARLTDYRNGWCKLLKSESCDILNDEYFMNENHTKIYDIINPLYTLLESLNITNSTIICPLFDSHIISFINNKNIQNLKLITNKDRILFKNEKSTIQIEDQDCYDIILCSISKNIDRLLRNNNIQNLHIKNYINIQINTYCGLQPHLTHKIPNIYTDYIKGGKPSKIRIFSKIIYNLKQYVYGIKELYIDCARFSSCIIRQNCCGIYNKINVKIYKLLDRINFKDIIKSDTKYNIYLNIESVVLSPSIISNIIKTFDNYKNTNNTILYFPYNKEYYGTKITKKYIEYPSISKKYSRKPYMKFYKFNVTNMNYICS